MKKNYFENERMEYEQIEIPEELDFVVHQAISVANKKRKKKFATMTGRVAGIAAAALILSLTLGANTSYAFAKAVSKIPVLKEVSQVLTFRDYSEEIDADPDPIKPIKKHNKQDGTDPDAQITPIDSEGFDTTEAVEKTPFEKWEESLTPEQLKQIVSVYNPAAAKESEEAGVYETTILLAYLPAEQAAEAGIIGDVAVYGYHENGSLSGVVVRMGDTLHVFADWTYLNEAGVMPDVSVQDLYGTGEKSLVVYLYNGLGTGIPVAMKESDEQQLVVGGEDACEETTSANEEKNGTEKDTESVIVAGDSKVGEANDSAAQEPADGSTVIISEESEKKTETVEIAGKESAEGKVNESETADKEQEPQVIVVEKELTEAEKTCQVWVLHVTDNGLVSNLFDAKDFDPVTDRSEN